MAFYASSLSVLSFAKYVSVWTSTFAAEELVDWIWSLARSSRVSGLAAGSRPAPLEIISRRKILHLRSYPLAPSPPFFCGGETTENGLDVFESNEDRRLPSNPPPSTRATPEPVVLRPVDPEDLVTHEHWHSVGSGEMLLIGAAPTALMQLRGVD